MASPLISILTPFRNSESFIEDCIDSVIRQSLPDWEIVLVDDHSTDNSKKLVTDYAKKDKRIHCLSNEGEGIIDALRVALKFSSGKYISRMDSDDIMQPIKLESMSDQLGLHGPGHIALGLVRYFPEEQVSEGYKEYETWINGLSSSGSNFTELYKECVIPSPCWMVYRDDLIRCGAFDNDLYPEDYDLTFRFYEAGLKCLPAREVLHMWRDYPTRTSKTQVHYQQEFFLNLKAHYFLRLHYDSERPLTLWGAGSKGKQIAGKLIDQGVPFHWISHNPLKIGKRIMNQPIIALDAFEEFKNPQSIITVANPESQKMIKPFLNQQGFQQMTDYFFFC